MPVAQRRSGAPATPAAKKDAPGRPQSPAKKAGKAAASAAAPPPPADAASPWKTPIAIIALAIALASAIAEWPIYL